jgi:hypothetical protein
LNLESVILEQSLDIVELELRAGDFAKALAQLLENAPRTLRIDLARDPDGRVVTVFVAAQRPTERIGLLVGPTKTAASLTWSPPRLTRSTGTTTLLLLRLRLRHAPAQRIESAALRIHGAVRVALSELALRLAHRFIGFAELISLALPLLLPLALLALARLLTHAALAHLLEQLLELIAKRLLPLLQVAHGILIALLAALALLALLATLALLVLLAALTRLAALAALILTLLEGLVAQLLLLAG